MGIEHNAIPSPCFVVDAARLRANLEVLDQIRKATGATVLCALKGFATHACFPLMRPYLDGVAASSLSEVLLGAREFGKQIHAYAPAYPPADFAQIARLSTHVTFNSVAEYMRHRPSLGNASPGLRINPGYAEVDTDLYNPCLPGSRLGVAARSLEGELPEGIRGLHMHALCEKGSDTLERTLEHVEADFGPLLDRVQWFNLGGGHAITREGYDLDRLHRLIARLRERHPNLETIVLEPGSAVAWHAGELVSTVLDIVDADGVKTAMLDVSFSAHMPDCLEMPYRPAVIGAVDSEGQPGHRYHLGGTTCLAGDYIPDFRFSRELSVGDRIVFADMLHYTMVKTTMFNGVTHPSIAIAHEDGRLEVVKRFGYEDYRSRL